MVDGRLYVGDAIRQPGPSERWLGFLRAFDAATGALLWWAETGAPIWHVPLAGEFTSSPAVGGCVVLLGDDAGEFAAFDAATGFERWRVALGGQLVSSPGVAGGGVYFGSFRAPDDPSGNGGFVHAIDAATGAERWQFPSGDVFASPAVVGGIVYIAAVDGTIFAIGGSGTT